MFMIVVPLHSQGTLFNTFTRIDLDETTFQKIAEHHSWLGEYFGLVCFSDKNGSRGPDVKIEITYNATSHMTGGDHNAVEPSDFYLLKKNHYGDTTITDTEEKKN